MPRVAFEKRRGGRGEARRVEQALVRPRQTRQHFFRPAIRKPEHERLHRRRRRDFDRVWLAIVQDQVTAVIDGKLPALDPIQRPPVEHALERERQPRRLRKIGMPAAARKDRALKFAPRIKHLRFGNGACGFSPPRRFLL